MKTIYRLILAMTLLCVAAVPASAQFRIGPRVGMNVNKMHFSSDVFNSDNRSGFTAGLMAEFMLPIVPIGLDASVMYARRTVNVSASGVEATKGADYIDVPINLKWKLGLPVVGSFISPYLFTGPSFGFRVSGSDTFNRKKCDVAWNLGAGIQLVSHLQIGASYGWGLSKTIAGYGNGDADAKARTWTVTAAWLF